MVTYRFSKFFNYFIIVLLMFLSFIVNSMENNYKKQDLVKIQINGVGVFIIDKKVADSIPFLKTSIENQKKFKNSENLIKINNPNVPTEIFENIFNRYKEGLIGIKTAEEVIAWNYLCLCEEKKIKICELIERFKTMEFEIMNEVISKVELLLLDDHIQSIAKNIVINLKPDKID